MNRLKGKRLTFDRATYLVKNESAPGYKLESIYRSCKKQIHEGGRFWERHTSMRNEPRISRWECREIIDMILKHKNCPDWIKAEEFMSISTETNGVSGHV